MEVKDTIIFGAFELYKRYGIKSITMDEVARHLSISKKTIYQYFEDKDALVLAIVTKETQTWDEKLAEITKNSLDVIEEMQKTSDYMRVKLSQMNPSMMFDMKKYHPKAWIVFEKHKKSHILDCIKNSIERGVLEGYFRNDLNIDVLAILRSEQISLSFDITLFAPEKYNLVDVNATLFEHFLYGICTLKGHERLSKLKLK
jgi:TetR/AcrR family transcriptional regulator, cholesterol catabolism regulator